MKAMMIYGKRRRAFIVSMTAWGLFVAACGGAGSETSVSHGAAANGETCEIDCGIEEEEQRAAEKAVFEDDTSGDAPAAEHSAQADQMIPCSELFRIMRDGNPELSTIPKLKDELPIPEHHSVVIDLSDSEYAPMAG